MVQRRTISIPDELDERLERLQDHINVSRVCAAALEKEVAMLEATPVGADADVQSMLRRLQTAKERWHQRGREDGRRWAVDAATRDQLRWVGEFLADKDGATIAALAHDRMRVNQAAGPQLVPHPSPRSDAFKAVRVFPKSFPVEASLNQWKAEDERAAEDRDVEEAPESGPTERNGAQGARGIDEPAYWTGWRDAVREMWQAVAPGLS